MISEFLRDLGIPSQTLLESQWTSVHGVAVHSRSSKAAPDGRLPFVLIHGLVISSLYMIPLAELLADEDEVHALDLPGFGRSHAPAEVLSIPQLAGWVIDWLSEKGLQRCHFVANSMGCEVAAHLAVQAPERVSSITLIGPTLDPQAFAKTTQTLRLLQDAIHEPARLWINWLFDFCRAGLRRSFGTTREMFRDHIENQLPRVTAHTLVIRGSIDPTVPASSALMMTRLLPHGDLLEIKGEPHCVHYTDPGTVCRAIRRHADLSGGRSVPAMGVH